jgi:hypothetical protein
MITPDERGIHARLSGVKPEHVASAASLRKTDRARRPPHGTGAARLPLGQVSKQPAAKPAKQEEQRFCTRAATDLDGVAGGHADVERAVAAANEAGAAAAALAASSGRRSPPRTRSRSSS